MGMKVSDLKIEIKEEITKYVFGQKEIPYANLVMGDLHEIIDERFEKFYDSKQVNPREWSPIFVFLKINGTYLNLNKSGDKKKSHSVRGDSYFVGAYLFSSPYSHLVWWLSEGTGFKFHT